MVGALGFRDSIDYKRFKDGHESRQCLNTAKH